MSTYTETWFCRFWTLELFWTIVLFKTTVSYVGSISTTPSKWGSPLSQTSCPMTWREKSWSFSKALSMTQTAEWLCSSRSLRKTNQRKSFSCRCSQTTQFKFRGNQIKLAGLRIEILKEIFWQETKFSFRKKNAQVCLYFNQIDADWASTRSTESAQNSRSLIFKTTRFRIVNCLLLKETALSTWSQTKEALSCTSCE